MVNFLVRLFLPRGLGLTILLSLMTSSHAENYPMPPIEVGKGLFALSTPVVDEVKPRHVRYLIEDHPMSLEEVVALDSEKWSRLKLRSLSFGRGSRPVWIHLSIANLAPHIQERLVELRWTNMHQVAFYSIPRVQNEDGSESLNINELVSYKTGLETLPGTDEKSGPFHLFPLTLEAQAQVEIFLRVQSDYLLFTPLKIWPVDQYTDYEQSYVSVHALFFGMFLSLLLYNLMISLVTQDKAYVYYTAYLAASMLYLLSISGIGQYLIWPHMAWVKIHAYPLSVYLTMFFGTLFSRHLLKLDDIGGWYLRINQAFAWYWGLSFVVVGSGASGTGFATDIVALLSIATSFFYGISLWLQGYPQARLFTLGWSGLIITAIIHVLMQKGILEHSANGQYAMIAGYLIEVLILALALAKQMNREKQLREQAQQELLRVEQEQKQKLEGMVAERTRQLERLTQHLSETNQELTQLSSQDGLTGVANRRTFDQRLKQEMNRCCRNGQPLTLIMVDVDHFKQVNDQHGHAVGDVCLQFLAASLSEYFNRSGDCVARYGGEEFAVILSACNAEEAFQRAETFRQHIEKAMIQIEDLKLSLTVSQGIFGATPCQTGTSEDWIKAADAALYDAKRSGRNRCQIAA